VIVVFGDLLLDVAVRLQRFPLDAGQMQPASRFELGPGGAGNVAIACARFGLEVTALGEIGSDEAGEIVGRGLSAEGVDTSHLALTPGAATPVAAVFVDDAGQPSYVGYPGTLRIRELSPEWRTVVETSEAVFADGWVEHERAAEMVVEILAAARARGVPSFFDPGPGNPSLDNGWHERALAETRIALVNEAEVSRLTGLADPLEAARHLLNLGPGLVILKRGREGCVAFQLGEIHVSPGIPVATVDTTGAGDSVAAAVMYGFLRELSLADLADLANATGAAKVQKAGTGRNMPTLDEIRAVLRAAGRDPQSLLPTSV
jgi:sugar/nucleoside kinase (ribokinase family)